MIEMKEVMKKYSNGTTAIRNLSISIDQGEFVLCRRTFRCREIDLYQIDVS